MYKTEKYIGAVLLVFFLLTPAALAENEDLPSRPVLAVGAGVLPTSPFYFLDRLDEWAQKNIFSFGLGTFHAQSALERAAERIAEIQVLESRGQRNSQITRLILERWLVSMEEAATVVGDSFQKGGRPINLAQQVIRTSVGSVEAVEDLFNNSEQFQELEVNTEGNFMLTERTDTPYRFLDIAEDRILADLIPETAAVPADVLRMITLEQQARAQREINLAKSIVESKKEQEIIYFGSKELLAVADKEFSQAKLLFENNNYLLAIDFFRTARDEARLASSNVLRIDPEFGDEIQNLDDKIETAVNVIRKSGYIDEEDLENIKNEFRKAEEPEIANNEQ